MSQVGSLKKGEQKEVQEFFLPGFSAASVPSS